MGMFRRGDMNMKANPRSLSSLGFPVLIVVAVFLAPCFAQVGREKKVAPTVLFVCEHGAAKSVIAAAYFDKLAKEKHLPHRAAFRGVNPDAVLNPVAKRGLEQDGIETSGWKPILVKQKDIEEDSRVVTLGCLLPTVINVTRNVTDWDYISSPGQNYELARDEIKKRVSKLVDDLAKAEGSRKQEALR